MQVTLHAFYDSSPMIISAFCAVKLNFSPRFLTHLPNIISMPTISDNIKPLFHFALFHSSLQNSNESIHVKKYGSQTKRPPLSTGCKAHYVLGCGAIPYGKAQKNVKLFLTVSLFTFFSLAACDLP